MLLKPLSILLLTIGALVASPAQQSQFIGIKQFDGFTGGTNDSILVSPVIKAPLDWTELIVSWNVDAATDGWIKVEASAIYPDHRSKFYTMGVWGDDSKRGSVRRQKDADGKVDTDTLIMTRPGADVQLRLTQEKSKLKFLGLSFFDSRCKAQPLPANHAVWGKIITTPERSQDSYPQEQGWCSPTSMSMVLARWGEQLHRSELNIDVPEVAAGVYDPGFGTGNWPFNTAFAGGFSGMRAYVTRLSDISEVEDWIQAGIPVVLSAPWHLLQPGRHNTGNGHLVVCIGFTEKGDVVINDPATNLQMGQHVRHIYTRENVIKAWKTSGNTVYIVYPDSAKIPPDRFGQWDQP
jgi:uncharacterized protein YvpB